MPGEEVNHASVSGAARESTSCGQLVMAAKLPLVRAHWEQWQATAGDTSPRISYRTPPHRQPPRRIARSPRRPPGGCRSVPLRTLLVHRDHPAALHGEREAPGLKGERPLAEQLAPPTL